MLNLIKDISKGKVYLIDRVTVDNNGYISDPQKRFRIFVRQYGKQTYQDFACVGVIEHDYFNTHEARHSRTFQTNEVKKFGYNAIVKG